jgi:hypothetical protein
MNKYLARISFLVYALSIAIYQGAKAQQTALEKKTDEVARKAIRYLNNNLPDSVYALSGTLFQKQLNPAQWTSVYKSQLKPLLPFKGVTFISSKDSVNKYKVEGTTTLAFLAGLDQQGKLDNFLFQPYQDDIKSAPMNEAEKKVDGVFKKVYSLINQKQADSVYSYAGSYFRSKIDAKTWKNLSETGLFPLIPLPEPVFTSSKNGVNKYRLGPYQFVFSLDQEGKYNVLALQPYQEEKQKATKVFHG